MSEKECLAIIYGIKVHKHYLFAGRSPWLQITTRCAGCKRLQYISNWAGGSTSLKRTITPFVTRKVVRTSMRIAFLVIRTFSQSEGNYSAVDPDAFANSAVYSSKRNSPLHKNFVVLSYKVNAILEGEGQTRLVYYLLAQFCLSALSSCTTSLSPVTLAM